MWKRHYIVNDVKTTDNVVSDSENDSENDSEIDSENDWECSVRQ